MSIIGFIKGWRLDKVFKHLKKDGAKLAISITETIKGLLDSGTLTFISEIVSKIIPATKGVSEELIKILNKTIPKLLAAELAVVGLPDNPTEQDILDFEKRILDAFGLHDNKSKLYITVAAGVYGIIKADVDAGKKMTFAELVADVEKAYKLFLKAKADNPDAVIPPLVISNQ